MIFGGAGLLLAGDQILEVSLLGRSALEQEKQVEGLRVFHRAQVRGPSHVGADIALQGCQDMLVDGFNQTRRRRRPGLSF